MRALKGRPAAKITSAFDPDAIVLEIYILLRLFENIDICIMHTAKSNKPLVAFLTLPFIERKFHLATGYAASTKAMVSLIPDVARAARRAGGTRLRTFGSNKLTFVLSAHPTPIRL